MDLQANATGRRRIRCRIKDFARYEVYRLLHVPIALLVHPFYNSETLTAHQFFVCKA